MNAMVDSSVKLRIESHGADRLSVAMMLGCTNDGFTGLKLGVALAQHGSGHLLRRGLRRGHRA